MRVFIIAALTADGFIGRTSDHLADWTGSEDKKLFVQLTKEAGIMVMGARTFATIGRGLSGRRTIVYTTGQLPAMPGVETTTESPAELIARLEREGHQGLAVCGGQAIYELFMRSGLVTEMYLTFVPVLFGSGLPLLSSELSQRLELLETHKLDDGSILAHYRIVR